MFKAKYLILRVCVISVGLIATSVQATEISVFGDASYSDTSDNAAANSAFAIGGIDLFVHQDIDDKTAAFAEVVFENDGGGFILDVERLWISRSINKNLNIALGRFHTPLGYWNRAYHHGALLFDTISRPTFLDFEDGDVAVLPVHIVGLQADGKFSFSSGDLAYVVNYGNGSSYNTDAGFGMGEIEINNVSDTNDDKSGVVHLSFVPRDSNLRLGFTAMNNVIAESGTAGASGVAFGGDLIDQVILGVDAHYAGEQLDVTLEYYSFDNDDKFGATGSETSSAAYVQFGYQVTDNLKPVYRFETIDFEANDAYGVLLGVQSGDRHVAALRYDLDETNALKFEIADVKPDGGTSTTEYAIQWAFLIP